MVRENPSAYGFEEEVDLDDSYEDVDFLNDLTGPERAIAERVLDKLREERGSNPASPSRLKVLDNVVGSQLSNEQLLQLIQGVWGVATVKKLKNDQVEALISWGKEDDFAAEADLVLSLLQEGEYASSDR